MVRFTFNEFLRYGDTETLQEKQIVYNGKKYGEIVFLAGGAASGKGFAIKNFMRGSDFKVRDVDELKLAFMKLDEMKKISTSDLLAKYGAKISAKDKELIQKELIDANVPLSKLDLKNAKHVYILHVLVKATGTKDKTLDLLLAANGNPDTLPNIIFDITFKDTEELDVVVPKLLAAGYNPQNIHLTWVLTDYNIAIVNNKKRDRVVPDDILLNTHLGAAQTVYNLVTGNFPSTVRGGIYVILNNPENTILFADPKASKEKPIVVKNFTYLTLRKPGGVLATEHDMNSQLYQWIQKNSPPGALDKYSQDR